MTRGVTHVEGSTTTAGVEAPVGVLVVDDQRVFREVAREVIDATENFVLLGYATSGELAISAADALEPDLVLLDIRMPGMNGIDAAGHLSASHPETVIVLISIEAVPSLPGGISSCGAATLVRKQEFGPQLLRRLWERYGSEPTT